LISYKKLRDPLSTAFYGSMSGLGFAIAEGVAYSFRYASGLSRGQLDLGSYVAANTIRFVSLPLFHAILAGIVGYFIGLTILTISLTARKEYNDWPWLFATIILILLIIFYQKLHEKTYSKKEFSAFSSAVITIIFAYLLSLHLVGIFNLNSSRAYSYKSPNNLNNQIVEQIKSATRENDEIAIISNRIAATYPVSNYIKKSNPLPSLHLSPLYEKISGSNKMSESDNYLLSRLKQQIERRENKLIFVQKSQISFDRCAINFLEYYLRDPEFKKVFLENYVFLNQLITLQKAEKEVKFFDDKKALELPQSTDLIDAEVEVYIKKNDQ
jgi:hypothetical protein